MAKDLQDLTQWEPDLDICHPIDVHLLPNFGRWCLTAGFRKNYRDTYESLGNHNGHDFMIYFLENSFFQLKRRTKYNYLSKDIAVSAIADGVIALSEDRLGGGVYGNFAHYVAIQHNSHRLASGYCHMIPVVGLGEQVKRGQTIGYLHPGFKEFALHPHLHFELGRLPSSRSDSWHLWEHQDPILILPGLKEISSISYS